MSDPSPVVLVAHRLGRAHETGIDRYVSELTAAIGAADQGSSGAYVLTATGEREPPGRQPTLPLRRVPGPRPLVHVSWTLLRRPRIDTLLGLRPRLVHVLSPIVPVPTAAPLVVTVHDLTPLQFPDHFGRRERWLFERAVAHMADHADHVITDSHAVADDVTQTLGIPRERITVVPLGVAPSFFTPPLPSERDAAARRHGVEPGRYLIHVGMVNGRKNLETAVRAFAAALPNLPEGTKLLLAGPAGPGVDAVAGEIDRLRLGGTVVLGGYIAGEDLLALIAGAGALVHPSLHEGFGLTILEAMAAGTPVVASDAGALPEVVGAAGVLLDPLDVDAWAIAVVQMMTDAGLRSRLADAGPRRAAEFTWAATAERTVAVHRAVAG